MAEKETRTYRKRKRAIREEETRRRITEVAMELHRTLGPARTTVTDIAERAGVSRMTVYNHFPTEAHIFGACSSHWFALHPFPDVEAWLEVSDPGERVEAGLGELYAWYRDAEDMMEKVLRDEPIVPAVGDVMAARWWPVLDRAVDVLSTGWPADRDAAECRAALRLFVDFRTWQTLTRSGLDDARATALACRMLT